MSGPWRSVWPPLAWLVAAVLTGGFGAGAASELVMRDIELSAISEPVNFSYSIRDDDGTREGSGNFNSAFGAELGGLYSLAPAGAARGLVVGAALSGERASYTNGSLVSGGVEARGGYGWSLSNRWTVLALGSLGLGYSTFELRGDPYAGSLKVRGPAWSAQAMAEIEYGLSDSWLVSARVGWSWLRQDMSGDGLQLDLAQSGLAVAIGCSYRISSVAERLE